MTVVHYAASLSLEERAIERDCRAVVCPNCNAQPGECCWNTLEGGGRRQWVSHYGRLLERNSRG